MSFHYERLDSFLSIPFEEQGPIFLPPSVWVSRLSDDGVEHFQTLPNKVLNRHQVRGYCQDPKNNVLFGYLCAMAWGNQGPGVMVNHAINVWRQREAIAERLIMIRDGNLNRAASYDLFAGANAIAGLGPSYLTKLLYFFSPEKNQYIMDQWTTKSINFLIDDNVVLMSGHAPSGNNTGANYEYFCAKVDELVLIAGAREQINTGEQIEQRLFSRGGHNPGAWRIIIRAAYPKHVTIPTKKHQNEQAAAPNEEQQEDGPEMIWHICRTLSRNNVFHWFFDKEANVIHILRHFGGENANQRLDEFSIEEIWNVLVLLNGQHGTNGFPLANNVKELPNMQETDGLGAAHYAQIKNGTRAQAASQLAAIFCEKGITVRVGNGVTRLRLAGNMNRDRICERLLAIP